MYVKERDIASTPDLEVLSKQSSMQHLLNGYENHEGLKQA